MKALYKSDSGPGFIDLVERPEPVLNEIDNTLVRVKACAICGMDHRIVSGTYPCKPPMIMGHELVGTVERIEGDAQNIEIGDRVILKPHLYSCGKCAACKMGLTQFCKNKRTVGIDRDGAMTKYVAVPASALMKVPDEISDSLACILEPFSMIYGNIAPVVRRENAKNVLIIGAGQVGMFAMIGAKAAGAKNVIMSGITNDVKYRFEIAKKLGADTVIDSLNESIEDKIFELTDGVGVDIVLDASGSETGINQAVKVLKYGGTFLAVGMTRKDSIGINWDACLKKSINMVFHMQSNYKYMDEAISFFKNPYTDLSPLISTEMKLSEWEKMFKNMEQNDTLKNVFYID